ncbi:MAG: TetR/AcrR family transcriptional regulator [Mycolicibacterium sp.]|uniref:TetR/AcrR family transcriptional regulator n=1 Tax=Mycolicibacterium sp. TaxID=2320850 RepID=UPI00355E05FF
MPRTVDHGQRRAVIAEAVVRVAGREGLHAVTMRAVAAEAGVSVRLVQYYFHSKAQLMVGTLDYLEGQSHRRWAARLQGLGDPPPPRTVVEAFAAEALPTDEASRVFHLVGTSYAMLAFTDAELARRPFIAGIDRLCGQLADALSRARDAGDLAAGIEPDLEARRLVALANGLGTGVLAGQHTPDTARAILAYHAEQVFRR